MFDSSVKIILAQPRGFCAGVNRAIKSLDMALQRFGRPIYVRHAIVHNRTVVRDFENKGAIFVSELSQVPRDARVVLSAHGSPKAVLQEAKERGLHTIDATCPLVSSVHKGAQHLEREGCSIILIGSRKHQEVIGTMGQVDSEVIVVENINDAMAVNINDQNKVGYITQTTLNIDDVSDIIEALKSRFPNIIGFGSKASGNICYATKNRQDAARKVASMVDLMLVIGSPESSNSNRLKDVCSQMVKTHLIDSYKEIDTLWLKGVTTIGVSAGASAPEFLVDEVIKHIGGLFSGLQIETFEAAQENVSFALPKM